MIEYAGERIPQNEACRRDTQRVMEGKPFLTFTLTDRVAIDGGVGGNISRFINHSCSPNCHPEINFGKIWIVSSRDIIEGEELTFNYGLEYQFGKHLPCRCGSPNCIGVMVAQNEWWKVRRELQRKRNA